MVDARWIQWCINDPIITNTWIQEFIRHLVYMKKPVSDPNILHNIQRTFKMAALQCKTKYQLPDRTSSNCMLSQCKITETE